VSDVENKVPAMYARGMSQRDISATIDDKVGKIGRLRRSILKGSTSNIRLCRTTFC